VRVLVTGGTGFLGGPTVRALARRGVRVRAVVRPGSRLDPGVVASGVEVFEADLRIAPNLTEAFDAVDVLVHLAAGVTGDDAARFAATATAIERLLDAMACSATRRLLLVSSFSVYDWDRVRHRLDERAPLAQRPTLYERDGYAVAKAWQERITREAAEAHGWDLRVVRPGFIWGPGNPWVDGCGHRLGRLCLVVGPLSRPPLVHVEDAADAVATVATHPGAASETFNLVGDAPDMLGRTVAGRLREWYGYPCPTRWAWLPPGWRGPPAGCCSGRVAGCRASSYRPASAPVSSLCGAEPTGSLPRPAGEAHVRHGRASSGPSVRARAKNLQRPAATPSPGASAHDRLVLDRTIRPTQ